MGQKIIEGQLAVQGGISINGNSVFDSSGGDISGKVTIEGALTLPNSPDNPETAVVTDTYSIRKTANSDVTGLTVVDNSIAEVLKVEGSTVKTINEFDISKCQNSGVQFDAVTGTVSVTNNYACIVGKFTDLFPYVNVGKTYTFACTVELIGADKLTNSSGCVLNENILWGGYNKLGYVKNVITITENHLSKNVGFYGQNPTAEDQTVTITWKNLMCVEGDYSNKEMPAYSSFFTGLKNAKFQGLTSNGENLCHITSDSEVFTKNPSIQFDADTQIITVPAGQDFNTMPSICKLQTPIPAGTTVTISVFFESGYIAAGTVRVAGYHFETGNNYWATDYNNINTHVDLAGTVYSCTSTIRAGLTLTDVVLFIYSGTVIETDLKFQVMLTIGDTVPIEFKKSGLVSTLLLPESINVGLGTTIDFENQKILESGADIVFTGDENFAYYFYRNSSDLNLYGNGVDMSLSTFVDLAKTWTSKVSTDTNFFGWNPTKNSMNISGNHLYWLGCLDAAGITSSREQVTDPSEQSTLIANFKLWLKNRYESGNPVILRAISNSPVEIPFTTAQKNAGNVYTVWNDGSEKIDGNVNEKYQASLTITQKYSINENPKEAANKAYVNNGLAKKLDKTGGTITGHLVVENGTNTTLPALIVTNNEYIYGLALEDDTYKLGEGSIDNENNFTFNDGEGLPIALRDDSSAFTDGELIKWSADGNKLSGTNINVAEFSDISRLNALINGLTDAQIAALNDFAKTLA